MALVCCSSSVRSCLPATPQHEDLPRRPRRVGNEHPPSIVRECPVPYAEESRVPMVYPCICERYDAHIWLGEREKQRKGEGCAREEQGDGGEVLGVEVEGLCEEGAETYFYSQNLPTVALLLPRAALPLALLLSFSQPDVSVVALADTGDATFFRVGDGMLSDYARGYSLATRTAWKVLVLWCSW